MSNMFVRSVVKHATILKKDIFPQVSIDIVLDNVTHNVFIFTRFPSFTEKCLVSILAYKN